MPKSFIKWAGGKAQMLKYIKPLVPKFDQYYEPFVGGGAVFWSICPEDYKKALLSDSNGELMTAYKVIRDDVEDLITLLRKYPNDKDFFLQMRAIMPNDLDPIPRAARFIYLNKTCFNGLYRVNKSGGFNSPFGKYKNPKICDEDTLRSCNRALQGIELTATYFQNVLPEVEGAKSFVYLDPPYVPIDKTSFVSYSKKGFGLEQHEELAKMIEGMDKRGVKVLLSNSDTEWCRERYKGLTITEVHGRRSINSNGKGRGNVGELLIRNY